MNVYLVNNALMNLKLAKGYSKKQGTQKRYRYLSQHVLIK